MKTRCIILFMTARTFIWKILGLFILGVLQPTFAASSLTIDNFNHTGTITVITDAGELSNVSALPPSILGDSEAPFFPAGLVSFEVSAPVANVQVVFSGIDNQDAVYYKFTSTFPGEAPTLRDFTPFSQPEGNGWTLHLTEGSFGDSSGNDQLIVDPGGPRMVVNAPPPPNTQTEPVPLSFGMVLLLSLLIFTTVLLREAGMPK